MTTPTTRRKAALVRALLAVLIAIGALLTGGWVSILLWLLAGVFTLGAAAGWHRATMEGRQ